MPVNSTIPAGMYCSGSSSVFKSLRYLFPIEDHDTDLGDPGPAGAASRGLNIDDRIFLFTHDTFALAADSKSHTRMAKVYLLLCFLLTFAANCFKSDPRRPNSSDQADLVRSSSAELGDTADSLATRPTNPLRGESADEYPAAYIPEAYLPKLAGKSLGLVVNQTSTLADGTHLVDTLLALGQDVRRIFAPEHGFRGDADAGAKVKDGIDTRTGLPIRSLYRSRQEAYAGMTWLTSTSSSSTSRTWGPAFIPTSQRYTT